MYKPLESIISYNIIKCLNESKVSDWITWWGKEFQSLIACGKKENLYESILAYKWMNLLAVLLVKEGESIRMWECGIATWLLIILKSIIKVSWSCHFSKESHPKSSNIVETLESLAKSLNTNLAAFRWITSIEWILQWVWGDQTVAAYSIIGRIYVK